MQKFGITLLLEIISNKTNIVLPLYIFYFTKYITPYVLFFAMLLSFKYQYDNTQYSTLTKIIEWIIFICPFIVFTSFYIKDILSKKETIIKNGDNIIRRGLFNKFPIRSDKRKKTEIASLPLMFNFGKKDSDRKSSFTYGHRSSKYAISSDDDGTENNSTIRQKFDLVLNNDNASNFISEYNSRKPTIEMEVINKNVAPLARALLRRKNLEARVFGLKNKIVISVLLFLLECIINHIFFEIQLIK
jgi:hypothetical protein